MNDIRTTNYMLLILTGISVATVLADTLEGTLKGIAQTIGIAIILFSVYELSPMLSKPKGGKK